MSDLSAPTLDWPASLLDECCHRLSCLSLFFSKSWQSLSGETNFLNENQNPVKIQRLADYSIAGWNPVQVQLLASLVAQVGQYLWALWLYINQHLFLPRVKTSLWCFNWYIAPWVCFVMGGCKCKKMVTFKRCDLPSSKTVMKQTTVRRRWWFPYGPFMSQKQKKREGRPKRKEFMIGVPLMITPRSLMVYFS